MYISKIEIRGFRNFKNAVVEFHEGVNVLIGHNNSGKSNLLRALQLVMEPHCRIRKLGVNDFCKTATLEELRAEVPRISISVTLKKSRDFEHPDDLRTVFSWLTKLDEDYEAQLTYEFSLQEDKRDDYLASVANMESTADVWKAVNSDYLRYYVYHLYGGSPVNKAKPESEKIDKFDYQFLGALRNVEDELFSPRSTLLHDVLKFFIDYQIKTDKTLTEEGKAQKLHEEKTQFGEKADELIEKLLGRLDEGKKKMMEYADETGASLNNAKPDFDGAIGDEDLFNALRLIVKYETGIDISITHNGLGYNNLIYMSLLLAKMQADTDGDYLGSNAKVFPILVIEEPEAHLHPSMQYKFLKFLKKNYEEQHRARQVFVSTHSTQIAAAVKLDEMICLHSSDVGAVEVCYPGRTFSDTEKDVASKKYVQRFLDATKSDMLFAQKVIFVEGIAEELLMDVMARYMGVELNDHHVAVVNVNGRYFRHFIKMFDTKKCNAALPKKVVCITDRDPERKDKTVEKSKYEACYPYEYGLNTDVYEYKQNGTDEEAEFKDHPNIHFYSQDKKYGKTFEYDLMRFNPDLELLLTEGVNNQKEIKAMMGQNYAGALEKLKKTGDKNKRIKASLEASDWGEEDKRKALIASRYLNSVGKGENALELSMALTENIELPDGDAKKKAFVVPDYIEEAIEWLLK